MVKDEMTERDGFLYGAWKRSINAAAQVKGSIHDEETAQRVGMRGGAVAGTMHLDLFPPLLVKTFGQRFFEHGCISIFYTYAMTDGEEVRAIIKLPPKNDKDVQVEARVESLDNHLVAQGTVSVGNPVENAYLQTIKIESSPQDQLRILKGLKTGDELPAKDAVANTERMKNAKNRLEDVIDWYYGKTPWGTAIVPPSMTWGLMGMSPSITIRGVGFFGGTEIRYVNGPIKVGVNYHTSGKIIAVGVTNRTEYYWFESELHEKETGKLVAKMRHMTRFMKQGSPLYPEIK
jgi:hypothetical protein